ncbi:MAG: tetratricopeptide repeat protein, partial [Fimbriimonadaceae bacterium]
SVDIEQLCTRLDGFPLSIELAAAKSRVYSPAEMLQQLNDRFEFLSQPNRRQGIGLASLLDALDWSFERLSEPDQKLLSRLSIFEGGFTLDAAEQDCGAVQGGAQIESLISSAWIESAPSIGASRFRLLESVRDYGADLLQPRDRQKLEEDHAYYFQKLAVQCAEASFTPEEPARHRQVQDDIHNIELAWNRLRTKDFEATLDLLNGLYWYDILAGRASLAEMRMKEALSRVDLTPRVNLGRAYHNLGNFHLFQGRFAESVEWFTLANEMTRSCGDELFAGLSSCQLARAAAELGDAKLAEQHVADGIEFIKQVDGDNWMCAALVIKCLAANRFGMVAVALESGREAVRYGRRGGYPWGLASALNELAMACHLDGDYTLANTLQYESLDLKYQSRSHPSVALSLADLTATLLAQGNVDKARTTLKDCVRILEELDEPELFPRLFANAAELLHNFGETEVAKCALAKFVELTNHRRMSASESESFDSALRVVSAVKSVPPVNSATAIFAVILRL